MNFNSSSNYIEISLGPKYEYFDRNYSLSCMTTNKYNEEFVTNCLVKSNNILQIKFNKTLYAD